MIYNEVFKLNFTIQFVKKYKWLPSIILEFVQCFGSMHFIYCSPRLIATKVDSTYFGLLINSTYRISLVVVAADVLANP